MLSEVYRGFVDGLGLGTLGLVLVSVAFALLSIYFVVTSQKFKDAQRIAELIDKVPGPPKLPIIGNAHHLKRDPWQAMQQGLISAVKYGPIWRLWLTSLIPVIIITQPEVVREVLSKSHPKSFTYKIAHHWLGISLLTSTWKRKRKMITPAFHFGILRNFINTFNDCGANFVKQLDKFADTNQDFDLMESLTMLTLDIISRCAFGFSIEAQTDSEKSYARAVLAATKEMLYHLYWIFIPDFLWNLTPSDIRFKKILHDKADEVIKRRQAEMQKDPKAHERYHDFLQILLNSKDEETGEPLSLKELRDEVNTFLFEGHDTTASSLMWIIYMIAQRPHVLAKIREELNQVFGENELPTYETLGKLRYLPMVIKESLRLCPPVPMIGRELDEDTVLCGYRIPAKVKTIWVLHHNPLVWENPEEFIPERFDDSNNFHPYAWVPFSAGPRNCIGQTFAFLEEKVILSHILRKFDFEVVVDHPVIPDPTLILRAKNGIKVRVKRLQSAV